MKNSIRFALLTLILVFLFAGCIGSEDEPIPIEGGTKYTYGILINEFSSLSFVDAGEETDVNLLIQNYGEEMAEDILIDMYQKGGFSISNTGDLAVNSLYAEDKVTGVSGEIFSTYWTLKAPQVDSDMLKTIKARITYDYKSKATSNIYLVSKDDWETQGAEAFNTYSTSTIGPVIVSIIEMPAIKINDPGTTSKTVSLNMAIRNTGNGRVEGDIQNFKLNVKQGDVVEDMASSCEGVVENNGKYTFKLYGTDQERSLKCQLDLPYEGGAVSHIIEAELSYTYYIDTEPLSIQVKKV